MPSNTAELSALLNLISEAETILSTTQLPQGRAKRALELLRDAQALAEHIVEQLESPAAALSSRGGMKTAHRGPVYFKNIAAMRKAKAGGRPRRTMPTSAQ